MVKLNFMKIPFNKPFLVSNEIKYILKAKKLGKLSGDGYFTKLCHTWLEKRLKVKKALLTTSCTSALEMMAILAQIKAGDEIIMPSYTFVSTANAFVLRGGVPVFIDINPNNMNMDEKLIEPAITKKTKAIVAVHYAGMSSDLNVIKDLSKKNKLFFFEDAAQAILSTYRGQYLGSIGDMGALSFHETKNVISGEGGCLLINNKKFIERAEIIREKGTNRSKYYRGEVDKYTWVDVGSSFLPSEITSAFLYAQLQKTEYIIKKRLEKWKRYYSNLEGLEKRGLITRPKVPIYNKQNGHLFYILVENVQVRQKLIDYLKRNNILSVFHYIPLHSSPAGRKYGKTFGEMKITESVSVTLLRLPLYFNLRFSDIDKISDLIYKFYK